ncbi:MAG: Ig-like domain-containing protein, partial [Proteobacteria bacterium]|nr:Ig-like domain-containing protein [Pseudomonadota bacterium]
ATASTQLKFFLNSSCTVAAGFSGVSDATGNFAIGVTVGADTTTTFYAVAVDNAQNSSACSNGLTFVQDSTRPDAPSGLGTSPGSPANNNNPILTGSAESGTTVKVYAGAGCTTLLVSGASTGTFSITLPALADNVTKTYTVDATDAAGNVSSCAGPITYVEDSLANAPSLTSTTPATPSSTSTTPRVNGTAEANATIAIFSNATCTNPSIGSATVTGAGTFGVSVSVPANTTTLLYGKITDLAGNVSACSAALAYSHDKVAPTFAGPTTAVATSATAITVSWLSATDNLSPQASLIYEVCASTTPAGCTSWVTAATSSAGATSVAVPGRSTSVRYFLRVRVKDQTNNLTTSAVEVTDRTWGPGAAVEISTALDFSCELLSEGTVRCWGNNSNGQLGNNSTTTSLIPVAVMGLTDVTQVSAGGTDASTTRFACALKSNGTVWCWGNNRYGQLGTGNNTDSLVPVQVVGVSPATALTNVRAIGAAGAHMCAILVTGSIYCGGYNGVGNLGDATTTAVNRPTNAVVGITNAVSVSGGTFHTCALLADGTVKCWGQATNGKLGQGSIAGNFSSPVAVMLAAGTYARALDVGQYHACIVTDVGTAQCWGQGTLGQLGDNLSVDASTPVIVKQTSTGVTFSNAVTVSAGNGTTCFTDASGGIRCAGEGTSGQLGNSGVVGSAFATLVTNSPSVLMSSRIAVGGDHACALGANGVVHCWGAGGAGQLGNNGTPATQSTYVAAVGNDAKESAVQIVAGRRGTCARMSNGKVLCWGFGFYGELGAGSTSEVDYPLAYVGDGTNPITDFIDISRGESFACGVRQTGSVVCWGANNFSQLGNGTSAALPAAQPAATSVLTIGNAYQVSAGLGHACATRATGSVTCWGDNTYGQIGDGTVVTPVTTPYTPIVASTLGARRVRAQGYGTCAVMVDGTAQCWGYNNYGGAGDGTSGGANSPRKSPVVVTSMTNAVELGGNYIGTCASLANGTIKCWGYGSDGEIGNGTVGSTNVTPTQINGGAVYLPFLSGGDYHTCAAKVDGTVYCWGKNLTGQLGDNTQTSRSTPTLAIGVDTVKGVGVAGGQSDAGHSCVLHSDGYADCWGDGASGKLGNNDLSMQLTAQPVIYFP